MGILGKNDEGGHESDSFEGYADAEDEGEDGYRIGGIIIIVLRWGRFIIRCKFVCLSCYIVEL